MPTGIHEDFVGSLLHSFVSTYMMHPTGSSMPAKEIEKDEASWTCPYIPGIREVVVYLSDKPERRTDNFIQHSGEVWSAHLLQWCFFHVKFFPAFCCCSLASCVLEGWGETLGKQREVAGMRHGVFVLPSFNESHSRVRVLGLTHPTEAVCAVR